MANKKNVKKSISKDKIYEYPVKGMHCKACETIIAMEIGEQLDVSDVTASLKTRTVSFIAQAEPDETVLNEVLKSLDYELGVEKLGFFTKDKWTYLIAAATVLIAGLLVVLFGLIGQSTGFDISNVIGQFDDVPPLFGVIMGLVAGVSTCAALVGGLVASVSANYSESHPELAAGQKFAPHLFFNLGRIGGFAVFGAIIGALGSAFSLSTILTSSLLLVSAFVMLVLGLQLSGIFPKLAVGLSTSEGFLEKIGFHRRKNAEYSHLNSAILGILTFFLPCGFTLTVQLYSATLENPILAAITMALFAVGTTPGLLLIGGTTSAINPGKSEVGMRVFNIFGVIITIAALYFGTNAVQSLAVDITSASNFTVVSVDSDSSANEPGSGVKADNSPSIKQYKVTFTGTQGDLTGGDIKIKRGESVQIIVEAQGNGAGCMAAIQLEGLSALSPQYLKKGNTIKFDITPNKAGEYFFTCAMGIKFDGAKIIVV
jgi:sulfite exporter TauE/SafE